MINTVSKRLIKVPIGFGTPVWILKLKVKKKMVLIKSKNMISIIFKLFISLS